MIEELTPPPNRALCRFAEVATELELTDPAGLQKIVLQVSDQFVQGLNRSFAKTDLRETIALESRRHVREILLSRTPVEAIASVTGPNGEVIPAEGFVIVDAEIGLLRFRSPQVASAFDSSLIVDYTGGYILPDWPGQESTLPPSIERAAIEATKAVFEVLGGGSDIERESIGDYSATFRSRGEVIAPHLAAVSGFRRPGIL